MIELCSVPPPISNRNHGDGRSYTFRSAHERLLGQIQNRMRNGRLTERALARALGISQSHINNVLRGRRNLSHELADAILSYFNCSLLDLCAGADEDDSLGPFGLQAHAVTVLKDALGPGCAWPAARMTQLRYESPIRMGIPECAVLVRLAPDPRMASALSACDMALLDTSLSARLSHCPSALFVFRRDNDAVLRWIRSGAAKVYIADDYNLNHPLKWESLPVPEEKLLDIIKARVLWAGKESDLTRA